MQLAFLLVDLGAQEFGEIKKVIKFYTPVARASPFGTFLPFVVSEKNRSWLGTCGTYILEISEISVFCPTLISTLRKDPEVSDFLQMCL